MSLCFNKNDDNYFINIMIDAAIFLKIVYSKDFSI